ncbi:hypothetical protein Trydic_g360 [Trypoxylus dichotomus]
MQFNQNLMPYFAPIKRNESSRIRNSSRTATAAQSTSLSVGEASAAIVLELKYDLRFGCGKNYIKRARHVSAVISRLLIWKRDFCLDVGVSERLEEKERDGWYEISGRDDE